MASEGPVSSRFVSATAPVLRQFDPAFFCLLAASAETVRVARRLQSSSSAASGVSVQKKLCCSASSAVRRCSAGKSMELHMMKLKVLGSSALLLECCTQASTHPLFRSILFTGHTACARYGALQARGSTCLMDA